jgi:SAM-dependent methyltransferase
MSEAAPPPHAALMQLITGKWVAQAISVAARFRVADLLAAGPKTCAELAQATNTHPGALYRVMRALGDIGVFAEHADGRFALTPLSEHLRSDVPVSLRAIATYCCDPWSWAPWGELAECVRTGQPAFDRLFGQGVFDYFGDHPAEADTFNEGMTGFSRQEADAIVSAYDFSRFGTLVDVGSGHGALLAAILKANPKLRGVVFDAPAVVEGARKPIQAAGLADRCRVEAGDFFQSVPIGGDAYILKHIVHDWNDPKATAILKNCRAAIKPDGVLLLAELVIPPAGTPSPGKFLDLEMLVICDGKERTEAEYRDLLAGAGFRLTRVVPTGAPIGLVEAVPA